MITLALAALQAATWTAAPVRPAVGDTVVISRLVDAPPRASVHAAALEASEAVTPLSPPAVIPRADGVLVRYTVALFRTGPVTVHMPAIEIRHPTNGVDAVPADSITVQVASILPPDAATDTLPARPSQAPVAQPVRRPLLAALPVAIVLLILVVWGVWRRRPRRSRPTAIPTDDEVPVPVARWLQSGEVRVSAAWGIARLKQVASVAVPEAHAGLDMATWRAVVGEHRPDWPLRRLDDVLERLERARFAPLGPGDVEEVLREVDELVAELTGAGRREPGDVEVDA